MDLGDATFFESSATFREWLDAHHADQDELWVGYWKKSTGRPSLTWEESVDEALCYGWIDGVRRRLDEEAYAIRFTPRRERSTWSRRNVDRYRELDAAHRIKPAGARAFRKRTEENSENYSFERKTPATLSDEYTARLRSNETAWADWEARPTGYRKQVAHWVMSAKREATRERRFAMLIADLAAGRKVKPLR